MRVAIFLTIGATIFALGESLQCYDCVEVKGTKIPGKQKCTKPFSSNDSNSKCTDGDYCMKGIGSMDSLTVIVRQCIPTGNIPGSNLPSELPNPVDMQFGPVKITAHLCNTDLCNSAALASTTVSFIILSLVTIFFV